MIIETIKKINHRDQVGTIIEKIKNPIVCEVGVRFGNYFDLIVTPNVFKAYGVDIWRDTGNQGQNDAFYDQNSLDNQYCDVFKKYMDNPKVTLIREFSSKAANFFDDEYFDFIYIDADHTYESVKTDLDAWYPKVKKGGILSGHDFIPTITTIQLGHAVPFGVEQAVFEFKLRNNISEENFHLTNELYASYYIVK